MQARDPHNLQFDQTDRTAKAPCPEVRTSAVEAALASGPAMAGNPVVASDRTPADAATLRRWLSGRRRGTTLTELMIGLTILMILGAATVPGAGAIWRSYHLRSAADELVYAVDFARGQAMANRRAYGIQFTEPKAGGRFAFSVVQGTSAACASITGGVVVRVVDMGLNNLTNSPAIQITRLAPSDITLGTAFPCFKPDGRVIRADNGRPFSAPTGSVLGNGDLVLELQRQEGTSLIGTPIQVQIGYNGSARVVYGRPTALLQGSGKGGGP